MSLSQENVFNVTQSELDQILGAMRVLGMIGQGAMQCRSLTILGPNAPFVLGSSSHAGNVAGDEDLSNYAGPLETHTSGVPYPCWHCKTINRPVGHKRFYAVICGTDVGIFENWETVQPLVNDPNQNVTLSGARSEVFRTRAEAEERFRIALAAGEVRKL